MLAFALVYFGISRMRRCDLLRRYCSRTVFVHTGSVSVLRAIVSSYGSLPG